MNAKTPSQIADGLPKIPRRKAYECPVCKTVTNGTEYSVCLGCLSRELKLRRK